MSDWNVVKAADSLRPGDRIIFGEEIGGENEVVTVEWIANSFGTTEIQSEELDFTIDVISSQPMRLAPPEEEEALKVCIKCGEPIERHDWFMGHGEPTEVRWLHTNGHGTCDRFTAPKEDA